MEFPLKERLRGVGIGKELGGTKMRNLWGVEARWEEGLLRTKSKSGETGMEELPKSQPTVDTGVPW